MKFQYVFYVNKIPGLKKVEKDELKARFGPGWNNIIDTAYDLVNRFPEAEIVNATRDRGLLHMYVEGKEPDVWGAEGVLWKIERLSSTICEQCGNNGARRKELKKVMNFCTPCYIIYLNEAEEPSKLFKKGMEAPVY